MRKAVWTLGLMLLVFSSCNQVPIPEQKAPEEASLSTITPLGLNTAKYRIETPNVNQGYTEYRTLPFEPGDRVTINAGGCVQTGGHGKTWKRYVNPSGPNSDHLYHGLIWVPGATGPLVRIQSVIGSTLTVPTTVNAADLFLRLGYEDDNYADNGYTGHDDGTEDQCKGVGAAWVELTVEHNQAPTMTIVRPTATEPLFKGSPVMLRGWGYDLDASEYVLACSSLHWTSSLPGDPSVTGCDTSVVFATTGTRTLTLSGTDAYGATGSASVNINVQATGKNLPPSVQITNPANGTWVGPGSILPLIANVSDPENQSPLTRVWDVSYPYDIATGTAPNTVTITPNSRGQWNVPDALGCTDGNIRLRLRVTDPQHATGSDFVVLRAGCIL